MGNVHNHISGATTGTVIQAGNIGSINTSTTNTSTNTTSNTVIGEVTGSHNTGSGNQVNGSSDVHAPQMGPGSTYVAGHQSSGSTGRRNTFNK